MVICMGIDLAVRREFSKYHLQMELWLLFVSNFLALECKECKSGACVLVCMLLTILWALEFHTELLKSIVD